MTIPLNRRTIAAGVVVLLAGGGLAAATTIASATVRAPETVQQQSDGPAVAPLPDLSQIRTNRGLAPQAASPEVQPLVAPEECLGVSGDVVTVLRYAGDNRYETAVCASFWTWDDHDAPEPILPAQAVVLARGDAFPDALAGGPLAGHVEGPLLLTRPTSLPANVLTEIQRVLPPGGLVYLLGSTSAISSGVENALESAGFATRRIAGANRFETAIAIADELPDTSNFFFATGRNFPDALGATTAAANLSLFAKLDDDPETRPFGLLLTSDAEMPASVADFVEARGDQFGVWSLVTAGAAADQAAVSAFGADALAARFVGANRYATAAEIAEGVYTDNTGVLVGVGAGLATGGNFPDALAASAALAPFTEPLLLTNSTQLSAATRSFLENHAGEGEFLDVFGGPPAVSDNVVNAAEDAFTP